MLTQNINSDKNVKVLVVIPEQDSNSVENKGFNYELLMKIKDNLKDKYNFIIETVNEKDETYNSFINRVHSGEYDMCAGMFFQEYERERIINYTTPILIDANSIVYLNNKSNINEFFDIVYKLSKYIIIIIICGMIAGIILFFGDPSRRKYNIKLKKNSFLFFMRSMMTGISSMFGEMGYLAERSSLKFHGILISVSVFIVGFIFLTYIQSKMTAILLHRAGNIYNKNNISSKTFLGIKDDHVVEKIKKYGSKIEYLENMSNKQMVDIYISNKDKYDGCIMSYIDAYPIIKKNKNLVADIDFGNELNGFIINKQKRELLIDVNTQILKLRENLELTNICKKYFSDVNKISVCSLT